MHLSSQNDTPSLSLWVRIEAARVSSISSPRLYPVYSVARKVPTFLQGYSGQIDVGPLVGSTRS